MIRNKKTKGTGFRCESNSPFTFVKNTIIFSEYIGLSVFTLFFVFTMTLKFRSTTEPYAFEVIVSHLYALHVHLLAFFFASAALMNLFWKSKLVIRSFSINGTYLEMDYVSLYRNSPAYKKEEHMKMPLESVDYVMKRRSLTGAGGSLILKFSSSRKQYWLFVKDLSQGMTEIPIDRVRFKRTFIPVECLLLTHFVTIAVLLYVFVRCSHSFQ